MKVYKTNAARAKATRSWLKEQKLNPQKVVKLVNDHFKMTVVKYRTVQSWVSDGKLPRDSNMFFVKTVFPNSPIVTE